MLRVEACNLLVMYLSAAELVAEHYEIELQTMIRSCYPNLVNSQANWLNMVAGGV